MTKDIFKKYIWILQKLYMSGGMSYEELMDAWRNSVLNDYGEDIPKRTFHDYLKGISSTFGIDIAYKASGHKYYIEDSGELKRDTVKNWLINSFAVSNVLQESRNLKGRILFEEIPSGNDRLLGIIESMQKGRCLRITYRAFYRSGPSTFTVEPYGLKVFRQRWYMLAADPQDKRLRTYALDRLTGLEMTEDKYIMPSTFDMAAYYRDWFGIIVMPEEYDIETIRLKASARHYKRDYLLSLPLHVSQREVEHTPGYSVFEYRTYPTEDFFQEVLSHGPDVEILSPKWVRDEMRFRAGEMYRMYNPIE